jgi:hypothetical protein
LTANKCGLSHKKTWFKPKIPMVFLFKKPPKTWFKPEKPGLNPKNLA